MDSAPVLALPKLAFTPFFSVDLALPLVFYIVLGLYAIFTGVLYYHWNAYAHNVKVITATYIAYLAMTLPLLIIMATTALIF